MFERINNYIKAMSIHKMIFVIVSFVGVIVSFVGMSAVTLVCFWQVLFNNIDKYKAIILVFLLFFWTVLTIIAILLAKEKGED